MKPPMYALGEAEIYALMKKLARLSVHQANRREQIEGRGFL